MCNASDTRMTPFASFLPPFFWQFCIHFYVQPWDAVTSGGVSNLDMGRAIAGVVIHPTTSGASLQVGAKNMEKLATTGSL